jgi:hypothetical protein
MKIAWLCDGPLWQNGGSSGIHGNLRAARLSFAVATTRTIILNRIDIVGSRRLDVWHMVQSPRKDKTKVYVAGGFSWAKKKKKKKAWLRARAWGRGYRRPETTAICTPQGYLDARL